MRFKNSYWCKIAFLVLLLMLSGCRKKVTTLEEPRPEVVPEEVYVEPEPFEIDTSDDVSFNEAELEAEFQRKVNENLQAIYFAYDSYVLTQESIEKLAVASSFLMEHSSLRVLIEGHCDERGSSEYNMGLGENRSRVIKNYLANYGIPAIRLEITSWGKERLVNYGCVDGGCHSKNRRAEFKVLSK